MWREGNWYLTSKNAGFQVTLRLSHFCVALAEMYLSHKGEMRLFCLILFFQLNSTPAARKGKFEKLSQANENTLPIHSYRTKMKWVNWLTLSDQASRLRPCWNFHHPLCLNHGSVLVLWFEVGQLACEKPMSKKNQGLICPRYHVTATISSHVGHQTGPVWIQPVTLTKRKAVILLSSELIPKQRLSSDLAPLFSSHFVF